MGVLLGEYGAKSLISIPVSMIYQSDEIQSAEEPLDNDGKIAVLAKFSGNQAQFRDHLSQVVTTNDQMNSYPALMQLLENFEQNIYQINTDDENELYFILKLEPYIAFTKTLTFLAQHQIKPLSIAGNNQVILCCSYQNTQSQQASASLIEKLKQYHCSLILSEEGRQPGQSLYFQAQTSSLGEVLSSFNDSTPFNIRYIQDF